MKIKFEIKPTPKSNPSYTIYLEHKGEDIIELVVNKHTIIQQALDDRNIMEKSERPITDGILTMDKPNLKKFISSLQLMAKS